ncbi:uncharacterized protein LOC119665107 [Teleopsis dalmanni]|uniref:uncharacterized protein LOC119665107 n=1 Tax=Teleopsis dalmanni TaxID=139649 RepID=UPI0018CFBFCB|nr:uncharacterized protein LOC119665107 [Teleopsis dalmanni]
MQISNPNPPQEKRHTTSIPNKHNTYLVIDASDKLPRKTIQTDKNLQNIAASLAFPDLASRKHKTKIQTGMERYVNIKRKLSSQKGNLRGAKIIKINKDSAPTNMFSGNRFAKLAESTEEANQPTTKKFKHPPINLREHSSNTLVTLLASPIGSNTFHIVPLTRGNIHETKTQIDTENSFRVITLHIPTEE